MTSDRTEKLWDELVNATKRMVNGPISDRRTFIAYRDGLITAYAIVTGESESVIREDLMDLVMP